VLSKYDLTVLDVPSGIGPGTRSPSNLSLTSAGAAGAGGATFSFFGAFSFFRAYSYFAGSPFCFFTFSFFAFAFGAP